jgi:hypothetical protein
MIAHLFIEGNVIWFFVSYTGVTVWRYRGWVGYFLWRALPSTPPEGKFLLLSICQEAAQLGPCSARGKLAEERLSATPRNKWADSGDELAAHHVERAEDIEDDERGRAQPSLLDTLGNMTNRFGWFSHEGPPQPCVSRQ